MCAGQTSIFTILKIALGPRISRAPEGYERTVANTLWRLNKEKPCSPRLDLEAEEKGGGGGPQRGLHRVAVTVLSSLLSRA